MKLNFEWDMTEKDWKEYLRDHRTHNVNGKGVYGNCRFGKYDVDFQHTLDMSDWYPYANIFVLDKDTGYGETNSGRPYDYVNFYHVPIKSRSFESFKRNFEKYIEQQREFQCEEAYETTVSKEEWR